MNKKFKKKYLKYKIKYLELITFLQTHHIKKLAILLTLKVYLIILGGAAPNNRWGFPPQQFHRY